MQNLKLIITMAWRNLWRNRVRTSIMIAATLFAVFLAIIMRSVQEGVYERQIQNMVSYYSGFLQVQNPAFSDEKTIDNSLIFDTDLEQKITSIPEITSYSPRIESFALASSEEVSKGVMITGSDPTLEDELTGLKKRVLEGTYFTADSDELMLGKGLAKYLKVSPGDTVVFYGAGYHASTAVGKYPVAAILEFGAPQLNDNMVYMPLKASQRLFSAPEMATTVAVNLESRKDMKEVQSELQLAIGETGNEVKNWEELMPELVNSIEGDRESGKIMLYVLYMIIGFVIYGTLLMMIQERKREFSMLVAIGMKNKMLSLTLMVECIIMTVIGAIFGSLLSIPITSWLHNSPVKLEGGAGKAYEQVGFEPVITAVTDPALISSQTWVVAIMSIVLSIYPMIKLLKMEPLEGLRG
ncbi:FtsX-like permease family protein [Jiulongibacter sediminis]|jgi:ABC-type lipoprotein release transport system permease subunit|uniref:ABC transporter permease n=1 Tax=Jiulongibacter sediminis TaxID=1605367 RepID=UPI0026EFAC0F|nr:FtsX-like permease family protein [Jiulongibacter sediminis]